MIGPPIESLSRREKWRFFKTLVSVEVRGGIPRLIVREKLPRSVAAWLFRAARFCLKRVGHSDPPLLDSGKAQPLHACQTHLGMDSTQQPRRCRDCLTKSASSANYVQLFRSGALEAVETTLLPLKNWREMTKYAGPGFISFTDFETQPINAVSSFTQVQKRIGIVPPIFILITLIGV